MDLKAHFETLPSFNNGNLMNWYQNDRSFLPKDLKQKGDNVAEYASQSKKASQANWENLIMLDLAGNLRPSREQGTANNPLLG